MSESMDARVERSRIALMGTGMALLIERPNASLSEIATRAGVGRTTLYRQFKTREQLIQAIAARCLEELETATAPIESRARSHTEAIELCFALLMPLSDRLRFLALFWGVAEQSREVAALDARQTSRLGALIEGAKQEGSIDAGLPSRWVLDLIDGLLSVAWKLVDVNGYSPKEAADLVARTLFDGIGTGGGHRRRRG